MPRALTCVLVVGLAFSAGDVARAAWERPVRLDGAALSVPAAAVNARGDAAVAWATESGAVRVALRRAGARFAAPRLLARGGSGSQRAVATAMAADGTAVVAWAQASRTTPRYRVLAAVCRRGRCAAARIVGSSTTALRAQPELQVAPRGEVLLLWRRDDVPFQVARLRAHATRFGAPLTPLRLPISELAWAIAPTGRLQLVWTADGPDGQFIAHTSGRLGGRFKAVQPISPSGRRAPAIAVSPANAPMVAYAAADGVDVTVSSPGFERFEAPQRISPAGVRVLSPRIVAGVRGRALASWGGSGGGRPDPSDRVTAWSWLSSRAPAAAFGMAAALTPAGVWAAAPATAIDGEGTATAAIVSTTGASARLELRRGMPGTPLPAPTLVTTAPRADDAHLAWFSAAASAAGRHTIVAWSRGLRGPIAVYSYDA